MLETLKKNKITYLYALQQVAKYSPREVTHILQKIFERSDLQTRLISFRSAILTPEIGDGKFVGDLFVKLMAATTLQERKEMVEPFLEKLLQEIASHYHVQRKLAWLNAYYHGWKKEA